MVEDRHTCHCIDYIHASLCWYARSSRDESLVCVRGRPDGQSSVYYVGVLEGSKAWGPQSHS